MRRTFLIGILITIMLLFCGGSFCLAAGGDTPARALPYGPSYTFIITGPSVPAGQPYEYIGVLVSRYYAIPINSDYAGAYTKKFTYGGKDTWFISKDQMEDNQYCFPYDTTKEYHAPLFSKFASTRIYKFTAQHLYRFPDGKDILGDELVMYYSLINTPVITLDSNEDQTVTTTIALSGTVRHEDNRDVTVSAEIDGVTKSVVVSNTVSFQPWALTWDVTGDEIADGAYTDILITANDGGGGKSTVVYTGIINVNVGFDMYVYDDLNRLDYIQLPSGNIIDYQYDENGSMVKRELVQ